MNHYDDTIAFIAHSNGVEDVYKNIAENNLGKKT